MSKTEQKRSSRHVSENFGASPTRLSGEPEDSGPEGLREADWSISESNFVKLRGPNEHRDFFRPFFSKQENTSKNCHFRPFCRFCRAFKFKFLKSKESAGFFKNAAKKVVLREIRDFQDYG